MKRSVALGAFCIFSGTAGAAAVNLSTWTAESYPAVAGFNPGISTRSCRWRQR